MSVPPADDSPPSSRRIVVVGGGLAGLAAAAALAARGLAVTLLESRPRLGGRASSFDDASTGDTIDNCQHVAMGCCTAFFDFCRLTGIEGQFERQSHLNFVAPDGRISRWSAAALPAPLHLAPAFLKLSYLTLREKLAAARGLRALARGWDVRTGESFAAWLERQRQPQLVVDRFWYVVLVSALSESLDRIDVGYARKVFVDGFLANRAGWEVTIPRAPLDAIYEGPLLSWLERQGVDVRRRSGAAAVELAEGRATGVRLRAGDSVAGDAFILAVPQDRLLPLLPEPLRESAFFRRAAEFETAPISSVHMWFDRPITELPHAVFVDRTCQWLFAKPKGASGESGGYYQIVVSASRQFLELSTSDAIEHVRRELADIWPAAREANLLHARIVTEHKAVFSPTPGIDALRPTQQTPVENLFLAGDWTATGWPATMEGAVRSGYLAAERVLARLGRPASIVPPELPVGRLSRWLYGLSSVRA
ncbi:MAG: hydroxysqualene dehydroxylase HpnE [Planctomyces sp.]|nr:hydroxysqualene dehydroxylase HpnE [Planctomyces sp.]